MGLLYTRFKVFHHKEKLDSLPKESGKIEPPIQVRIKPTNKCNHNCWYCAYRAGGLQLGKDISLKDYIPKDKMDEILTDIIDMGVKSVTFSGGGEPFIYPYLMDAAQKLAGSPVKFAALTHGADLHGDIAEVFSKNATWIRISLDGFDDESYSKYRNVKSGTFDKVISNIRAFRALNGKCYIGAVITVDKDNHSRVYEFTSYLKDVGVHSVKVSPCVTSDDPAANNIYHREFFQSVKDQIARAKEKLEDKDFEVYDSYHELGERFEKKYQWCPYLQICPVIGADMNVYPCHDKAYNLQNGLLGSLKDQSFKDFWFSSKNTFYRINPSVHCNHHCLVNGANLNILEYLNADKDHLEFV